ncbi:MAG: hypothetical protein ACLTQI_00565 [Slackia sp.]
MLELKNLVFEVPVEGGVSETKRIIDDLSLTIEDGRFTVITGPNGGGNPRLRSSSWASSSRRPAQSSLTARYHPRVHH